MLLIMRLLANIASSCGLLYPRFRFCTKMRTCMAFPRTEMMVSGESDDGESDDGEAEEDLAEPVVLLYVRQCILPDVRLGSQSALESPLQNTL